LPSGPIYSVNIPSFLPTEPTTEFDSINENLDQLNGYLEVERRLRAGHAYPGEEVVEFVDEWQTGTENAAVAMELQVRTTADSSVGHEFRFAFQIFTLVLFGLVAAAIVSLDAGWRGPLGAIINAVPGKDKAVHFLVFGGLVVPASLALGLRTIQIGSLRIFFGTMLMLVISTTEEFSQLCFDSRTFDLLDLTANYLGIAFFSGVVMLGAPVFQTLAKSR
jgi:hypothetical protein